MRFYMKYLVYMMTILILLLGCAEPAEQSLRIGLMPAVDTAPIFLAQEKGYFQELGLDLEIILFTNAQDRQSALQTGQIDGAMTDLIALTVNKAAGFDIAATTLTDGMFPILAGEGSIEKSKISVGMMEISVSNFLVDQWLVPNYEVEKVFINSIPGRLEAVAAGNIDMGILPEPIATIGARQGLNKLIFEPVDGFSPDVMVFTKTALEEKEAALKSFHKAFNQAVKDIQKDEMLAREILIASIPNLSEELKNLISLPEYHTARLPGEDYLEKVIEWTRAIVPQELNISAADLVDRSFVD
jgi:NitT/TauT family transport system substrate-binding protein